METPIVHTQRMNKLQSVILGIKKSYGYLKFTANKKETMLEINKLIGTLQLVNTELKIPMVHQALLEYHDHQQRKLPQGECVYYAKIEQLIIALDPLNDKRPEDEQESCWNEDPSWHPLWNGDGNHPC